MRANILVVDGNENDVIILRKAFEKAGLDSELVHFGKAEGAKEYLKRAKDGEVVHLVVLEIDGNEEEGFGILKWIKSRPELTGVPVVIVTGSVLPGDKQRSETLGANAFFKKPLRMEEWQMLARKLQHEWIVM